MTKTDAQMPDELCDKDPQTCWSVRCYLGKQCAGKNRFDKMADKLQTSTASPAPVAVDWKSTDTAPRDGTPFYARFLTPMRFKLYSPKSQEFKRGTKGRWQTMNEYGGWDNCGYGPMDWMSHESYQALCKKDVAE